MGVGCACVALVVVVAPRTAAQELPDLTTCDSDPFAGSGFTTPATLPASIEERHDDGIEFEATITYSLETTGAPAGCPVDPDDPSGPWYGTGVKEIEVSAGGSPAADVCTAAAVADDAIEPDPSRNDRGPYTITGVLDADCNGAYRVEVTVTTKQTTPNPPATRTFTATINVGVAPGAARDLKGSVRDDGRTVSLSWEAPADGEPLDFAGYVVEHKVGDGDWERAGTAPAGTTTYVDQDPPEAGGEVTYRVVAASFGPGDTLVRATGTAPTAAVTVEGVPEPDPTTPGDGEGDGNSGNGNGPGGSQIPSPGVDQSGRGSSRLPNTSTTVDDGFDESLPFDEREPGGEDPVIPGDENASLTYEGEGSGLAVPAASAMVLAVWALHLRYLARAARPQ